MNGDLNEQFGDYRIVEEIGSGGMGRVYRAEHVHLKKDFAVKILPEKLAGDKGFVHRFYDEARVMSDLRHPGIVQVQAMSCHDGVYFLAMDYVTGPEGRSLTLHDHLRAQPESRLPEDQTRKWAAQIAEALAYAHGRGVVHRDIKPANIMIDADGDVKLTDFGLAKAIGNEFIISQIHETMQQTLSGEDTRGGPVKKPGGKHDERPGVPKADVADGTLTDKPTIGPDDAAEVEKPCTSATSILGTYDYMAPEQRGEGGSIDQRTDIYSFGVLLYRLLTGKRPVGLAKPPSVAVPRLSKQWDAITARCLASVQDERYQSADELLADLRRTTARVGKPARTAAAIALLIVAVAAAALLLNPFRETGEVIETKKGSTEETGMGPIETTPIVPEVTLTDVVPVKTKAETARKRIKGLDRGQGLGVRLDEIEELWTNASTFYQEKAYAEAKGAYESLLEMCNALAELESQRGQAIAAKAQAEASRDTARRENAEEYAPALWNDAGQSMAEADGLFDAGKFPEAAIARHAAKGKYGEALEQAQKVAMERDGALAAKAKAETSRRVLRRAGAQEDAPALWKGPETLFDAAQELFDENRFMESGRKWRAAAAEFAKAEKYAPGVASVRKARAQYETQLAKHDTAKLAKHGGDAWRAVDEAVKSVGVLGNDFAGKVAAYDKARRLLPAAARAVDRAALNELLKLDPGHAKAKRLREKIRTYDPITNSIGMRLVYIPPTGPQGFMMGSGQSMPQVARLGGGNADGYKDEHPQHRVILTKGFWMAATEVTREQWRALMGNNPSFIKGDDLPVEAVSWDDAVGFCKKLSRKEGKKYRLPSEAEWEYACRARTTTPFNTGQTITTDQANYNGNFVYGMGRKGVYRERTTSVGSFPPNEWGLHDMHGNVWEWCSDWYGDYSEGTVTDPTGPETGTSRVYRGGGWVNKPTSCRSAVRWDTPGNPCYWLGFRVCLDSE